MASSANGLGMSSSAGSGRTAAGMAASAKNAHDLATKGVMTSRSRSSGLSATSGVTDWMNQMLSIQNSNNAWSANQAAIQRSWQESQNKLAMDFNAAEAAKNRDWQQYMSNTAHQREIQDLQAAGLNPVLSAMGGNGAAVTSGATASGVTSSGAKGDTDTSASQAIAGLVSSMWQTQTQLEAARINAQSNQAIAERNNATSELVARIAGIFGNERAEISGRYGLQSSLTASEASRYAASIGALASMMNANTAASSAYDVQLLKGRQEEYMKKYYPQNVVGAASSVANRLLESLGMSPASGPGSYKGGSRAEYSGGSFGSGKRSSSGGGFPKK